MKREDEKTRLRRKVRELQAQIEQLQRCLPPAELPKHGNRQATRHTAKQLAAEIAGGGFTTTLNASLRGKHAKHS